MQLAKTDEPLKNYAGDENLLVIPITGFVKADGHVSVIDKHAKELTMLYPEMTRYFGFMISQGITLPVYRREGINVAGVIDRLHYAAGQDDDLVADGLTSIVELAASYPEMLVYMFPLGGNFDTNAAMFADSRNIVLLKEDEPIVKTD